MPKIVMGFLKLPRGEFFKTIDMCESPIFCPTFVNPILWIVMVTGRPNKRLGEEENG